jgi:hypothetical protein
MSAARELARAPLPALSGFAALALLGLVLTAAAPARQLSHDQQVMFVPNTARWTDKGTIQVRVDSWVYEEDSLPGLTWLFARHLDLDVKHMEPADRERFYARTQLFRVDSASFKTLLITFTPECSVDCQSFALPRSNYAGRSSARITLPAAQFEPGERWLSFAVVMPHGDRREFHGRALLVPSVGLSVISDIDDTIKISQVGDRQELLLNTFAREFLPVAGMADRYQSLDQADAVRFHYVSSSPMQLYPLVDSFLKDNGFPAGSVHLRESTAITNVIARDGDSRQHKLRAIGRLLRDFPQRSFLLIGDSGEADPEIYAEIARLHPVQVVGIRIRDVSGEGASTPRYQNAFAGFSPALWQVYSDAAELRPAPATEAAELPGQ